MKKTIILIVGLLVIIAAIFIWQNQSKSPAAQNSSTSTQIASAVYRCDEGKTISAVYYENQTKPVVRPGEQPVPTGSVEISLNGAASTTLKQTISASGVRYANADESFVFWNKGSEAIIMHNNAMDLNYRNCIIDYKNTTYSIDGQDVLLKNGVAETEAAPGSASKIVTQYFGNELKTDLNNDGREDVVFLLTQQKGGSGIFYYVVAALNTIHGYVGSDGYLLGDRIAPQTTEVSKNPRQKNVIVVNYADRALNEPMTAKPSIAKSVYLKLDVASMKWGIVQPNFEGESNR